MPGSRAMRNGVTVVDEGERSVRIAAAVSGMSVAVVAAGLVALALWQRQRWRRTRRASAPRVEDDLAPDGTSIERYAG